jgi:hypothetical protein
MNGYYVSPHKYSDNPRLFNKNLMLLNRQEELAQLVKWAQRKGHRNPLRLYESCLADTRKALFQAEIEATRVAAFARFGHMMKKVLFPRPKYYQRGSATAYKRGWLTA